MTPLLNTGTLAGPFFYREGRRAVTAAADRTILVRTPGTWQATPLTGDLITAYNEVVKTQTMPECYFLPVTR